MPKRGKSDQPARSMSRRQVSRWQELRHRQFIILVAGVFTILAVLLIMGTGWFLTSYRPLHETVIRVNNTSFNMQYFIDMLRIQSRGQSPQYLQLIAESLPKGIEQNELTRQAAEKLGITVSNDEIFKALKEAGLPNDAPHRDLMRGQLLTTRLTDEYFDKEVPAEAAQVNMQAMLLESEKQANEVRARLEKGESFTAVSENLSLDTYTRTQKGEVGWHPQDVLNSLLGSSVPSDYAFGSPAGTLSQPRQDTEISKEVGYWIIKINTKDTAEQADISAMVLGSLDEAETARARLAAGEDFAAVAKELSQLDGAKENGGSIGLVSQNQMTPASEDFIFNPETKTGNLSDPLRDTSMSTRGGYWLVNVLEKADKREISEEDRDVLKQQAFNEWSASLWLDPDYNIEEYLDAEKIAWAVSQVSRP